MLSRIEGRYNIFTSLTKLLMVLVRIWIRARTFLAYHRILPASLTLGIPRRIHQYKTLALPIRHSKFVEI